MLYFIGKKVWAFKPVKTTPFFNGTQKNVFSARRPIKWDDGRGLAQSAKGGLAAGRNKSERSGNTPFQILHIPDIIKVQNERWGGG